jgi:Family of unknown function (DUF6247)
MLVGAAIVVTVTSSAAALPPDPHPVPPADPQAIRAALSPALAAEFDSEWDTVLEAAKKSKSLAGVHELLNKWRHTAYMETRDPGSYHRVLAKAEQIRRTGHNPDAAKVEDLHALIGERLGR